MKLSVLFLLGVLLAVASARGHGFRSRFNRFLRTVRRSYQQRRYLPPPPPAPRQCIAEGQHLAEGANVLARDCRQIIICTKGYVRYQRYTCPTNTQCNGAGRCICSTGYKKTGTNGFADTCTLKECKVRGDILKEGEVKLARGCNEKFSCRYGCVTKHAFSCKGNTQCQHGRCICSRGYEKTGTTENGLVDVCKEKRCLVRGQYMQEGEKKLARGCNEKFVCLYGCVTRSPFSCGPNTKCSGGRCVCDRGYEKIGTSADTFSDVCKKKKCVAGGREMQEGSTKLSMACDKKFICKSGCVTKTGFSCPLSTHCQSGRCVCDKGYENIGTAIYGLVDVCKKKKCIAEGKEMQEGETRISKACDQKFTCNNGCVTKKPFICPPYTQCNFGRCSCEKGYLKIGTAEHGLVDICKRKKCIVEGKEMQEGTTRFSSSCHEKYTCKHGCVIKESYSCPATTHCQAGRCVCDKGYETVGTIIYALVDVCKKKICIVDGKQLKEGESALNSMCYIQTCHHGNVETEPYMCPENTVCKHGKCVCDEYSEKVATDMNGFVEVCKKRQCVVNGNEIENGDVILSKDCKTKYDCKRGTVHDSPFSCPDLTRCIDGYCLCDASADRIGGEYGGLVDVCEKRICTLSGKEMKEGQVVVNGDCTMIHQCELGHVIDRPFKCGDHSSCKNGKCVCDKGYEVIDTEFNGISQICEKKICHVNGMDMMDNEVKLSKDCKKRYECQYGEVDGKDYECPAYTTCNGKGSCLCDKGYEATGTDVNGHVEICKKKICTVYGKTLKDGQIKLSYDCKTRHECSYGDREDTSYECPGATECDGHGKCKCVKGHEKVGEDLDGSVEICDKKVCMLYGKDMKEDEVKLSNDCKIRHECSHGEVNAAPYDCPSHTTCNDHGKCVCDKGYVMVGEGVDGLADICEKKICKLYGKTLEEGVVRLSYDCKIQNECIFGEVEKDPHMCPKFTTCDGHGKCVCDKGFEKTGDELDGQVEVCKKKVCKVDGEIMKEGEEKFSKDCGVRYECEYGDVKSHPYACPTSTKCDNQEGKCVCTKGHKVVGEDLGGLVEICDKKVCMLNGETMKEGEVRYSHDCTLEHKCSHGDVIDNPTSCPDKTHCSNEKCVCIKGYKKTGTKHHGLIETCQKKVCKVDGKVIEESGVYVTDDCSKKHVCMYGTVSTEPLGCPVNTHCSDNRCVCNEGYKVVGTMYDGTVDSCELKPCIVDGMVIPEGGEYISEDCAYRYTCKNGVVEDSNFGCHDHTHCYDRRCVCDEGYQATSSDGARDVCEKKVCKVNDVELLEGKVILTKDCSAEITCAKGDTSRREFQCPPYTKCRNGCCVCDDNTFETGRSDNGLVYFCQPKDCTADNLKDGESKLSDDCTSILLCTLGTVTKTPNECGEDSTCNNGKCVCKPEYETIGQSEDGFEEKCKLRECILDGKVIEDGSVHLSKDCKTKYECKKGKVEESSFDCPSSTQCCSKEPYGKCVCKAGYEMTGVTSGGLVQECTEKKCTHNGKHIMYGGVVISNDCSQLVYCNEGKLKKYDYSCPIYTTCNNQGKCKCDNDTKVIGTLYGGKVEECQYICY